MSHASVAARIPVHVSVHKFAPGHPVSAALNSTLSHPSEVLAVYLEHPSTSVALCPTLGKQPEHTDLQMVFVGRATKGAPVRTLFDTGATNSFVSLATCRTLGLRVQPSLLHAVATASGDSVRVLGQISFVLQWGPVATQVNAHVLATLLPDIGLIAGQDFLSEYHAVLDYGVGQCTLKAAKRFASLRPVQPEDPTCTHAHVANHGKSEVPDTLHRKVISATVARRLISSGCKAVIAYVRPDRVRDSVPQSPAPDLRHVPPEWRDKLSKLLDKYHHVFKQELPPGLPANRIDHEVIPLLPNSRPPYRPMFRLSPSEMAEVRKQVTELLQKGLIEPSSSPFGAPVLFVQKKDGTIRLVYDYRQLNSLTIKNKWPLPRIDDLIDSLGGASIFSCFDLTAGYNQLQIPESDVAKTAFCTPLGHFQWKVLSFGLSNAPAAFQSTMQRIFNPYIGRFVYIYLDDICVASKTPQEHLQHLELVLDTLSKHNLLAKMTKCQFFLKEIK